MCEESADAIRIMLAIRSCRRIFGDMDSMEAQGEWLDLGPNPSLGNADLAVADLGYASTAGSNRTPSVREKDARRGT